MTLTDHLAAAHPAFGLFAGPGGFAEGMADLGIVERGIDLDPDACATAIAAGHDRYRGNVAALEPAHVAASWGQPVGIVAGPPCPGFAHGGRGEGRRDAQLVLAELARVDNLAELTAMLARLDRTMTDDRTLLALEPLRWALALGPRWLAWEQSPYVLPLWEACAVILRGIGYTVATGVLHAEAFGVPQVRKRAVLVARDAGASAAFGPAALPIPTHSRFHARTPARRDLGLDGRELPAPRTMADALGWGMTHRPYPAIAAGTARGGQDPMMLGGSGARAAVQRELEAGRWIEDPGRPPVLGQPWNLDTRRALRLTVAEAGVLQGFSRSYPWQGRTTSQFQQVGDAVPTLLARRIVQAIAA